MRTRRSGVETPRTAEISALTSSNGVGGTVGIVAPQPVQTPASLTRGRRSLLGPWPLQLLADRATRTFGHAHPE